ENSHLHPRLTPLFVVVNRIRFRLKCIPSGGPKMTPQIAPVQTYASQYDAISSTMKKYEAGVREGKSALMRPAFHKAATFFGHHPGGVMDGELQQLFDWVDGNGPSPDLQTRIASVEIIGGIAQVRLELAELSGALSGKGVSM